MKKTIIPFLIFFTWISCNEIDNKTNYKNADLFFRYIEEHQPEQILAEEFHFLVFRSKNICNSCYRMTLDSSLSIALSKTNDSLTYVLFDDPEFYLAQRMKYGDRINCLIDEETALDRYGLTDEYPLLFHAKKNSLLAFEKIIRQ